MVLIDCGRNPANLIQIKASVIQCRVRGAPSSSRWLTQFYFCCSFTLSVMMPQSRFSAHAWPQLLHEPTDKLRGPLSSVHNAEPPSVSDPSWAGTSCYKRCCRNSVLWNRFYFVLDKLVISSSVILTDTDRFLFSLLLCIRSQFGQQKWSPVMWVELWYF